MSPFPCESAPNELYRHCALWIPYLDCNRALSLVQTPRKHAVVRKNIFGALPWDMESIHSSRCSKYYPGFSLAYLASTVLALHKTVISKLSFGDIHQLAFRGFKKES